MDNETITITEITARPPQDFFDARMEAFQSAEHKCTIQMDDCKEIALVAHQKKLIIGDAASGYERKIPGVLQSADNLVICCSSCHHWIHQNPEEATALGYLDR